MDENLAGLFGLAAAIGAFLLLAFITYGMVAARRRDARIDPSTPADDPSRGLSRAQAAGAKPPLQVGLVAVLGLAIAVVGGAWLFANTHLIVKGESAPPTAQEAATGQTADRGPYSLNDFKEPRSQ
jgi:hypothetical protein